MYSITVLALSLALAFEVLLAWIVGVTVAALVVAAVFVLGGMLDVFLGYLSGTPSELPEPLPMIGKIMWALILGVVLPTFLGLALLAGV